MTDALSRRDLNRATLARQFLLERAALPAAAAIERLAGMQAQAPLAPYVGLWTRLRDFAPGELAGLAERYGVVRVPLMRNTVHLVSARDCLGWSPHFRALHIARFDGQFRAGVAGVDRDALAGRARRLLAERPRTRGELAALLAADWPDADPDALAYAAVHHLLLCQVPPRGVWGAGGPAIWAPVEPRLGGEARAVPVDDLVVRYLGAFGPARVADVQQWCGLTRLREVVERLPLRTFRGPEGELLYDLPDAPRPGGDVPAPPRFLPEYDNLLLSHRDRSRVIDGRRPVPLPPGNGAAGGTVLVDGRWQGTWRVRDGAVRIRPFAELPGADRDALLAEGERLAVFLAPRAADGAVLEKP